MDSLKRVDAPALQPGAQSLKRRKLDNAGTASPPLTLTTAANATATDGDEDDEDGAFNGQLEAFRKEAIYREMNEYKRKFERAQQALERLEKDKQDANQRLAAVDVSWNTLVDESALLLPSSSSPRLALTPSVSDSSLTPSELSKALEARSTATKDLLRRLGELEFPLTSSSHDPPPPAPLPTDEDEEDNTPRGRVLQKCHALLEESHATKEALRMLRETHLRTLEELEETHEALLRAEKKLDRLQSPTVRLLLGAHEGHGHDEKGKLKASVNGDVGAHVNGLPANGSSLAAADADSPSPSLLRPPPSDPTRAGSVDPDELLDLRALVESRTADLESLRHDRAFLSHELDLLKIRLFARDVPDEVVLESQPFRLLREYCTGLQVEIEREKRERERADREAVEQREGTEAWRTGTLKDASDQLEVLNRKLLAKESDLTRIRAQREDARAELSEFKAKDTDRVKDLDQLQTLADSRAERILAYKSEVTRWERKVKALKGKFDGDDQVELDGEVGELGAERRLAELQEEAKALQDQLAAYVELAMPEVEEGEERDVAMADADAEEPPRLPRQALVESETKLRVELDAVKQSLQALRRTCGLEPDSAADKVELAKVVVRLEETEKREKALQDSLKASEESTNMLYSEIDRLSSAWATLDEQNGLKVFSLIHLESKVQKLSMDKAKADNRYFGAMRQKDTTIAENQVLVKLSEKQQKAIETAQELQQSLSAQISHGEKEITVLQRAVQIHRNQINELTRENTELTLRNQQSMKQLEGFNSTLADRLSQLEQERANAKKHEEAAAKAERDLKTLRSSTLTTTAQNGDSAEVRELKKYNEDLSAMLKCSTCKIRFKSAIITRCSHLFCKECIDSRIANRQRKCPTCGLPFGTADVAAIYL